MTCLPANTHITVTRQAACPRPSTPTHTRLPVHSHVCVQVCVYSIHMCESACSGTCVCVYNIVEMWVPIMNPNMHACVSEHEAPKNMYTSTLVYIHIHARTRANTGMHDSSKAAYHARLQMSRFEGMLINARVHTHTLSMASCTHANTPLIHTHTHTHNRHTHLVRQHQQLLAAGLVQILDHLQLP
jgi:hypothetical protein